MIFIDSSIPMYLVGAAHPHKADAAQLLESAIAAAERLVTSAEVLQEILHRYVAIGRRDAIQPAFDSLLGVVDEVISIELADVERAREFVQGLSNLSARDALHAAVMTRNSIERIMTFDPAFDTVPGISRFRA
ncbi:MAG: type II toxin-antitoxin system VapC family toxin [Betaproteobacteria bacterium]|nr:MAG: type II toxin-antitoxin system VapC family toxin [Betaproteobacteria bacterium]